MTVGKAAKRCGLVTAPCWNDRTGHFLPPDATDASWRSDVRQDGWWVRLRVPGERQRFRQGSHQAPAHVYLLVSRRQWTATGRRSYRLLDERGTPVAEVKGPLEDAFREAAQRLRVLDAARRLGGAP